MAQSSSRQKRPLTKRSLIIPALLTFLFGAGMLPLKVYSTFFMGTPERTDIAAAASSIVKTPLGRPYLATSLAEDPESYQRLCAPPSGSIIVRTSTWMLLHGPTVEVCLTDGPAGQKKAGKVYVAKLKQ